MVLLDHVSAPGYVLLNAVAGFLFLPDPTGTLPAVVTLIGAVVAGIAVLVSEPTPERLAGAVGTTVGLFALLWVVAWALGVAGPLARPALAVGALFAVPVGYLLSPVAVGGLRTAGVAGEQ
jgi:hypothetical protein